jgi:phage FluMu protein Com
MKSKKVVFCPKCKKTVEAKDYFTTSGASDWRVESIGVTIRCSKCSYSGLPLETTPENYKKLKGRK